MHALSKMICNIHVQVIYLHVISWSASFANLKIMECFNIHGSTFAPASDLRRDFMFCLRKVAKTFLCHENYFFYKREIKS